MDNTVRCSHISRVKEWGFDKDHNFKATLWDCVLCGEVSDTGWVGLDEQIDIDHTSCDDDCFGCKVKTLELNAGDAKSNIIASGTTQKKWDSELAFYREARSQGVQPEGTGRRAVEKALEASEILNKPYNADSMPKSDYITTKTVEVMKEVGAV